jgi:hypothetical protein
MEHRRSFTRVIVTLFLLALPFVAFVKRWDIYDAWRLKDYTAPSAVITLADETAMNDKLRRLFYVNHPQIESKEDFRTHCTKGEQTIVLGCFVPFNGIYLQNIDDERLSGIMQVTTAHEALHAAYQRLSLSEKKQINTWLDTAFQQVKNERIKETIEAYRKDGADVHNELHSILGTEVRTLTPELEMYYKRYFADRSKVVTYSETYEAAFTSRKAQVADYDRQLETLKAQIDQTNQALGVKQQELAAREQQLNSLRGSNRIQEYNAAVPGYNQLVQSYNAQVATVRSLIDRYNQIVKDRNEIALEEGELVKAIDSRPEAVRTE